MLQEVYHVKKAEKVDRIEVSVPGSKSITNRALLLAALSDGRCVLHNVLFSDDSRHFLQALSDLGFAVEIDEAHCTVTVFGQGGAIPCTADSKAAGGMENGGNAAGGMENGGNAPDGLPKVYVGSAGTAARFLSAFLGLSRGRFLLDSSEQMKKRPMKELLDALTVLGAEVSYRGEEGHFPFVTGCDGWKTHEVTVDIEKSSQFLSALLIVAALAKEDVTIHLKGSHGMEYVKMTVRMMGQFGVAVKCPDEKTFVIPAGQRYRAGTYDIEPDVSAACYFYAMSPVLHAKAKVRGVHRDCMQGDIRFLTVLQEMGCEVKEEADGVLVAPPERGMMRGGTWDLSGFSDQALTLAAIAPFADSAVTIANVGHIRMQECDRIRAITENLRAMGISCSESGGTVTIEPGEVRAARIETYDDHRVAMAFAVAGLVGGNLEIVNPACCKKTFEGYFKVLEQALYRL